MQEKTFESLMVSKEFCYDVLAFSIKIIVVSIVLMFIINIASYYFKVKISIPITMFINIPRILISFITIVLVFCYDYSARSFCTPKIDDMLVSTFLVGALAVIEFLSSIAMTIQDILNSSK